MNKKHFTARRAVTALFVLYTLLMLYILIFPNPYRGYNVLVGGFTWERWSKRFINAVSLVPFRSLAEQIERIFAGYHVVRGVFYLIGNFIGFAPLGFFLPAVFVKQRKIIVFAPTVILAVAVVELAQVVFMTGSCDIDDLILNTAGACIGFWIMRKPVRRFAKAQK